MGLALQNIFVWQWCDHWFAQKRLTAEQALIANDMPPMLATKHAHAIGTISDSIHMLIALHRAIAMGICQWNIKRTRLPFSRCPGSPGKWKPSSAPILTSFAITLGTHSGGGQTVSKTHKLRTCCGQKPHFASLPSSNLYLLRRQPKRACFLDRKTCRQAFKMSVRE